jgi:hypothetical protein
MDAADHNKTQLTEGCVLMTDKWQWSKEIQNKIIGQNCILHRNETNGLQQINFCQGKKYVIGDNVFVYVTSLNIYVQYTIMTCL